MLTMQVQLDLGKIGDVNGGAQTSEIEGESSGARPDLKHVITGTHKAFEEPAMNFVRDTAAG
jgi:hypothetical protein